MFDIVKRSRRLREKSNIRALVRETQLHVDDFVYPIFVTHGEHIKEEIPSMPGIFHYSIDMLHEEIEEIAKLNIKAILIFGIPEKKDELGTSAYDEDGIVQQAVRHIKKLNKELYIITDVCLCQYTSHGHCGIIEVESVLNDPSVELIARTALSHARAGADMVAPSDMMDGRVQAIRILLDKEGYSNIPIMSYSAKFASSFYGPFREAAHSAPQFGDRKSYQMDYCNANEAIREMELDIEEGADIIMVKPALSYLDILRQGKDQFNVPMAAYNVSGEYAMIKAASKMGWINEKQIITEVLTSIKRAGADIIITYFAKDIVKWLKE
ncbi:porphobilinogen synthase [Serpentinicella alkaliphila]|uniref:Delta-aminolevulinic acid dehydratase n=1 Tax=Serpentinicella alkaliphila TaxID=1734049 RepID=A0A4R2TQY8_9FIRM|nr:porphobilinogen synthase [Serpentinicella alkaliphila]QUH27099.1 porphobilinogen synthase [Serpentinicella alkaliphila]TCQ05227.1 porphobilinogen synthase [Serpentinicella alkaliphila]